MRSSPSLTLSRSAPGRGERGPAPDPPRSTVPPAPCLEAALRCATDVEVAFPCYMFEALVAAEFADQEELPQSKRVHSPIGISSWAYTATPAAILVDETIGREGHPARRAAQAARGTRQGARERREAVARVEAGLRRGEGQLAKRLTRRPAGAARPPCV
jgi:hypothetical protein